MRVRVLAPEVAVALPVPGAEEDLPVGIVILLLGVFLLLRLPAAKASSLLLLLLLSLLASARAILLLAIYPPLALQSGKDKKATNKVQ